MAQTTIIGVAEQGAFIGLSITKHNKIMSVYNTFKRLLKYNYMSIKMVAENCEPNNFDEFYSQLTHIKSKGIHEKDLIKVCEFIGISTNDFTQLVLKYEDVKKYDRNIYIVKK